MTIKSSLYICQNFIIGIVVQWTVEKSSKDWVQEKNAQFKNEIFLEQLRSSKKGAKDSTTSYHLVHLIWGEFIIFIQSLDSIHYLYNNLWASKSSLGWSCNWHNHWHFRTWELRSGKRRREREKMPGKTIFKGYK